jgi:hypothetical protein
MSSQGLEILEEEFHPEPAANVHTLDRFVPPAPEARPPAPPAAPTAAPAQVTAAQLQALQAAQQTVQALASVLTARLAMFLVVVGALILAIINVVHPSDRGLIALGLFAVLIIPMSWLAQRRVT